MTPTPIPHAAHPPIKAILFDLDDTLWHLAPTLVRAEAILYDWLNVHIPGAVSYTHLTLPTTPYV